MGNWGSSTQTEVIGEAGEGGGELSGPSTWMIAAQSTGKAGDAALRFFLALVITGEMAELLLAGVAWAVAVSTAMDPTATAIEAASA